MFRLSSREFFGLSAAVLFLAAIGADVVWLDRAILAETRPNLTFVYLLRTAVLALSAVFAVAWLGGPKELPTPNPADAVLSWGTVLLSAACVALFFVDPALFNRLSLEDGPAESLSAALYVAAGAVLLWTAFQGWETREWRTTALLSLGAGALVFLGMEEVSWMQRHLSYDTPAAFAANKQAEANLHNFATDPLENIFYFLAFAGLVIFPLLRTPKQPAFIQTFLPPRAALCAGALATAYNYEMWNIVFMQFAFWAALAWMGRLLFTSRSREDKVLLTAVLSSMILAQFLFIRFGHALVRRQDVSEYRELLIPLGFFFTSLAVYRRAARKATPAIAAPAGIQ